MGRLYVSATIVVMTIWLAFLSWISWRVVLLVWNFLLG